MQLAAGQGLPGGPEAFGLRYPLWTAFQTLPADRGSFPWMHMSWFSCRVARTIATCGFLGGACACVVHAASPSKSAAEINPLERPPTLFTSFFGLFFNF